MVFFCRVILLHFVKGFSLKARILLRFNFSFPYRLPFKFVTTTRALFRSTQLMFFQLCIYEIRAPNTTQVPHLIHACFLCDGCDLMMMLSLFIKLYQAFNWISLTMEHSTTKHLSLLYNQISIQITTKTFLKNQENKLDGMLQSHHWLERENKNS